MSVAAQEGAAALHVNQRQVMGAVVASCMGWALDLFDLFVLLYVAPVVGRLFFPSEHAMLSLAAVYASFAVTLLMRPLGSALFGSYADRHGRKGAMIVAVVGVGLSTAAFGMLPTVAQVGLVAPVLFMLLRLVQGVFVGGVVASTHTIGTESVAPKYRGAVSGLIGGGWRGPWRTARVAHVSRDVVAFSRRSLRRLGLALHVLYRHPEFAARPLRIQ
ncbi:MFS family permease [Paraburkholderia sp. 35.1]